MSFPRLCSTASHVFCLRESFSPENENSDLFSVKMSTCLPFFAENMNYANGFPCPAVRTNFIDHSSQSAWTAEPHVPASWEAAGFVSSPVGAAPRGCGSPAPSLTLALGVALCSGQLVSMSDGGLGWPPSLWRNLPCGHSVKGLRHRGCPR